MTNRHGWQWRHNATHDLEELVGGVAMPCPICHGKDSARCIACGGEGSIRGGPILAWIQRRPPYCDRGHYMANVQDVPDLDFQDGFPRYYMDLGRAKAETEEFLLWRLYRERRSA